MARTVLLVVVGLLVANAAWAGDGQALYEKKCKVCHSIGGVGGARKDVGGALDDVGSKRDEAWIRAYMKEPKSKIENAKMPKLSLPDAETDAVVQYLLTLKGAAK